MMKRFAVAAVSLLVASMVGVGAVASAYAARKQVNCDQVMQQLNGGKKRKEVAKEMKISVSSVYRCRKASRAAQKKASHAGASAVASPTRAKP